MPLHWIQCLLAGLLLSLILGEFPVFGQEGASNGEWRSTSGDGGSTRYSPLDQVDRDNVGELEIAWIWRSDNYGSRLEYKAETTPIMVNGVLYFTIADRRVVVAADAGSGETLWIWRMDEGEFFDRAPRKISRGVAYWTDGTEERIFTVTPGFHLVALDAGSGHPVSGFGQNGVVDLFEELGFDFDPIGTIGNSSPPVISHDVVVVGPALVPGGRPPSKRNTKADVMAFDVGTGEKVWVFHTVPRPGEFGYDTWLDGSAEYTGNAGIWPPFTVDEELGYLYLPVEDATSDYYGGHRPGNNLFSASIVCVDIRTGERIWHQQLVHHDIWDYDMAATPILGDLNVDGKPIKALVQLTKQAFADVFDRVTGKPVWPMEERPVPQTDVPGEWTSPTQPFPTKPPPFDRQGVSRGDLIDFTPELNQMALQLAEQYRLGPLYTPPSLGEAPDGTQGTLTLPGSTGSANWEAGAADPETGIVYVGSQTRVAVHALVPPSDGDMDLVAGRGTSTVEGLTIIKPPYGRITAYDMNKSEIAWQAPNGETPPSVKEHPLLEGIDLPKTLLFAGEGWGGLPMFRAYDKATGDIIWEIEIPAGAQTGPPMTYMHEGRQYIVFTAGNAATRTPGQLIAYRLSE